MNKEYITQVNLNNKLVIDKFGKGLSDNTKILMNANVVLIEEVIASLTKYINRSK